MTTISNTNDDESPRSTYLSILMNLKFGKVPNKKFPRMRLAYEIFTFSLCLLKSINSLSLKVIGINLLALNIVYNILR